MALTTVPASLSSTALTLTTAAQPNITSVGTLTGLTVSGNIAGTLTTAAQTNITSVGTLSSLTVSGALNGTLSTAAQTNITSVGTLTGLTTTGNLVGTTATFSDTVTIDAADGDADEAYVFAVRSQEATAGRNYGMWIRAGSNSSDESFSVRKFDNSSMYFKVRGDGNVGIGTASPSLKFHSSETGGSTIAGLFQTNQTDSYISFQASGTTDNSTVRIGAVGDALRAYVNGAYRFAITSAGNVGIGTTGPSADYGSDTVLEIKGSTSPGLVINDTGQGSKYGIHADSNDLKINYGTNTLVTFQNDGNVGIGETSPSVKFHIKKTAASTQHYDQYATAIVEDTEARLQIVASEGGSNAAGLLLTNEAKHWGVVHHGTGNSNIFSIGYYASSSSGVDLSDNLSDILNITTGGNVGIGISASLQGELNVGGAASGDPSMYVFGSRGAADNLPAGHLTFRNVANGVGDVNLSRIQSLTGTGSNQTQKGQLAFSTNDGSGLTQRMLIDSSGKVGIGTTPSTPLHVRNIGNPSGGNRNTVETVLTLDTTGYYPYNGYGLGIDFKGEDYGNTAIREYGKIQAVMTDHSAQNASGDPSFKSALTFWTNTGGASSTVATEKMRIDSTGIVTKPFTPAFSCNSSGSYTTTTGDQNIKTFACSNATTLNIGSHLVGGKFTAPVDGLYHFDLKGAATYGSGYLFMYIFKNGSAMSNAYHYMYQTSNSATLSFTVYADDGDYFEPYINTNYAGGTVSAILFSGHLIG